MSERDTIIRVDLDDALSDVLDRVGAADGPAARLVIPAGSSLFLTAIEFRTLKDAADRRPLALTVDTADPLRLQLATMFGLDGGERTPPAIAKPERLRPKFAKIVNLADRARRKNGASAVAAPVAPVASFPVNAWPAGASARGANGAADAPVAVVVAPPVVDPGPTDAPPSQAARTPDVAASPPAVAAAKATVVEVATPARPKPTRGRTWLPGGRDAEPDGVGDAAAHRSRLRALLPFGTFGRLGWLAIALAILLVVGLLGLTAAAFFLPRATVAIVLAKQAVRAEASYRIVAPGAVTDDAAILTIPAEPMTREIAFELSAETSGVRRDPDAPASGLVRLVNPTAKEVAIEAGTTVASDGGVSYVFPERVVVPAGEPDGGVSGAASATVTSVEGGTAANIEAGELGGRLDSGVYYSNRTAPIAGGTDREVRVVAQEDLDTLRAHAVAELPRRATEAFVAQLGPTGQFIPASLQRGEEAYGFSETAGAEAANVTARVTLPVSALTFDADRVRQAVTERLREQLAVAAPGGYTVNGADLRLDQPVVVAEQADRLEYRVAGSAEATAQFTDADRAALRESLRGKDAAAADALLRANPIVERFSFRYAPDWFPHRMPRAGSGIAIETTT